MPILSRVVKIQWTVDNRNYYESKGYKFTDYRKSFKILVKDLQPNSIKKIFIKCDFCGNITKKPYHSCSSGICNCSSKECIKKRVEQTNLKRYGVKHAFQAEKVKLKIIEVLKQKYGVEKVSDIPNIKEKVFSTAKKHGNLPSSKQQDRLHRLFGGIKNYPYRKWAIDIAIVTDKIAIEYNGSGHNLNVQKGRETIEEFNEKENNRQLELIQDGWKLLIFISTDDTLTNNFVLKRLYQYALNMFNRNDINIIKIDFDKGQVIFDNYIISIREALKHTY